MILEVLGFILSSCLTGFFILLKFNHDLFPYVLKKWLNKLAITNWQRKLPQRLPVYNFPYPKSIQDSGVVAQENEYEIERPSPKKVQRPGDVDDLLIYGVDKDGNAIFTKISKLWGNWSEVNLSLNVNGTSYSVRYEGESKNPQEFSLGNFKLEMVEPFRVWRLWYNGLMRKDTGSKEELLHVVLNFLWKPLDCPLDLQKNANELILSEYFSKNGFGENFDDLKRLLPPGYHQFGTLHGIVKINGSNGWDEDDDITNMKEEKSLYLYGHRIRRHLTNELVEVGKNSNRIELFGICDSNGTAFRLVGFNKSWIDAHVSYTGARLQRVTNIEIDANCFQQDLSMPKLFTLVDTKSSLRVEIWPKFQKINTAQSSLEIRLFSLNINGKAGRGILIRGLDKVTENVSFLQNPEFVKNRLALLTESSTLLPEDEDIVDFHSVACTKVTLVGGKGASLARLAQLGKTCSNQFKTATGLCITTNLFRKLVNLQEISDMFSLNPFNSEMELEKICNLSQEMIKSSGAEAKLGKILEPWINETFQGEKSNLRFAVRSSGVLEDGAELSCAGQNATFLGVEVESIPIKIVQCWASLFTSQSVNYRLNHGQPAVSEMAVVIQEMVDASCAGVMFSADPLTGNPFEMLVTANYGLGESVVSASCDPDTFILNRAASFTKRSDPQKSNQIKVAKKILGEKKSKIVISETGATQELQISEEESNNFSLNDERLLKLGEIGIQIEKELGNLKPVDIEWAVLETGEIYILQCRAMTSLNAWTDFEVIREFDTATRSSSERYTRANTGEVMPKASYPLTIHTTMRLIDLGVQIRHNILKGFKVCPIVQLACPIYQQKAFLNVHQCLYTSLDDKPTAALACVDLTVFGRPVLDEEGHRVAKERNGLSSGKDKLKDFITAFKIISGSRKKIKQAEQKYGQLILDYDNMEQSSKAVHAKITQDLYNLLDILDTHCYMSQASSTTLVFAFMILTERREANDWSPSLYEDAGTILSVYSSGVESAEMPMDINNLGSLIVSERANPEEFFKIKKTNEAMEWLQSKPRVAKALEEFLDKHGHRSECELDMGQKPWKTDPTPLITLLKSMVRNQIESKKSPISESHSKRNFANDDELLNSLKTQLKPWSKMILKFLLPHCRKTVVFREKSKSLAVRTVGLLKEAYTKLGQLMVQEQLIPDAELVRHLAHYEMGLLIKKDASTSTILYKAMRRTKLYNQLDSNDFPEICTGHPEPIDNSVLIAVTDVIHATPVSSGKVQGIAKVCLSVEEASECISPGDILITKGTDIAWSPFFPIIGGVVTELGGLISHGAVVAREYGLPCIVGAINATKIFKTGDEVILDTSKGTISKVKGTSD